MTVFNESNPKGLRRLLTVNSPDADVRRRGAVTIAVVSAGVPGALICWIVTRFVIPNSVGISNLLFLLPVLAAMVIPLARSGRVAISAWIYILGLIVGISMAVSILGRVGMIPLGLMYPAAVATVLLRARGAVVAILTIMVAGILMPLWTSDQMTTPVPAPVVLLTSITLVGVVGIILLMGAVSQDEAWQAVQVAQSREAVARADSRRDPLTGCGNRRAFDEAIVDLAGDRHARTVSLLLIDVDKFKRVNDEVSHTAGDLVLQRVAQFLRDATRASDVVTRFGGDEFAIILPDTALLGAVLIAERIRQAVGTYDWQTLGTGDVSVTTSIGVSELSESGGSALRLIETADARLLQAKRDGRNKVVPPMRDATPAGDVATKA